MIIRLKATIGDNVLKKLLSNELSINEEFYLIDLKPNNNMLSYNLKLKMMAIIN